jgi:preprotein translocase subunit SecY
MVIYRLGTYVPIPGINIDAFAEAFQGQSKGILGMFNMFSGGAVERNGRLLAERMPYISASIIVQPWAPCYPPWEKLRKEGGEAGRKTLNQYTRYLTVVLAVLQSFGIAFGLSSTPGLVSHPGMLFTLATVATLTGGTMFLMWIGEQITSRGGRQRPLPDHLRGIVAVVPPLYLPGVLAGAHRRAEQRRPAYNRWARGDGRRGQSFSSSVRSAGCSHSIRAAQQGETG